MSMREPVRPIPKKEDPAERIVRHAGVLSSQMQAHGNACTHLMRKKTFVTS